MTNRITASVLLVVLTASAATAGTLARAGSLRVARNFPIAELLDDGLVLVAGSGNGVSPLELFDPRAGGSTLLDADPPADTATRLAGNRVLLLGGGSHRGLHGELYFGSTSANLFDPTNSSVTELRGMNHPRTCHAATLLGDGRVLVTGGHTAFVGITVHRNEHSSAEIFDPATGLFRLTTPMHERRSCHAATALQDGRVLIVGGTSLEIFDPHSEAFTVAAPLHGPHHFPTATLLRDGRVLIVSGSRTLVDGSWKTEATGEIFDPRTNEVTVVATLGPRYRHTATLLPNGHVLIGDGGAGDVVAFDPMTSSIVEVLALDHRLEGRAAVALPDGSVLLIGGLASSYGEIHDVLRYQPSTRHPKRRALR